MTLRHKINVCITEKNKQSFEKKTHRVFDTSLYNVFKLHGEGLFECNLKSAGNDIPAKIISLFSHGYTHSLVLWYNENFEAVLTAEQKAILTEKLAFYYEVPPAINTIKVLVMASADASGMNYFDFSTYQSRHFSLFKVKEPYDQNVVIDYLFSIHNDPYDAVGLVFQPLKWFDDDKSVYCSEEVYDAYQKVSIKMAEKKDPSPYDIEEYNTSVGRLLYVQ